MKTKLQPELTVQPTGSNLMTKSSSKTITFLFSLALFLIGTVSVWAQAPANDACSGAITLTLGPGCTIGSNVGATADTTPSGEDAIGGVPGCWASDPDATVWYTFTTGAAGFYSISTNNGTNDFDADAQLKLYSGSCGSLTLMECSEDLKHPDNNTHNTLSSIITANLSANTTYYIAVDIFGGTQGQFCINVYKDVVAGNDCILDVVGNAAYNLNSKISSLSSTAPINCTPYFYNAPSDDSVSTTDPNDDPVDNGSGAPSQGCNGTTPATQAVFQGVWFEFSVSSSTKSAWVSAFANNNDNLYVLTLFKKIPDSVIKQSTCGTSLIKGLTKISCSTADGLNANNYYPGEDKAATSNFTHPRLDISGLDTGKYYLRVSQFTRVLIDTTNTAQPAPPSEGIFNLCFEAPYVGTASIDGDSHDLCNVAGAAGSGSLLTNAGGMGNIYVAIGGTAETNPQSQKPLELTASANSGSFNKNCDPANAFIASAFQKDVNVPSIYSFTTPTTVLSNTELAAYLCDVLHCLVTTLQGLAPAPTDPTYLAYTTAVGALATATSTFCTSPVPPTVDGVIQTVKSIICPVLLPLPAILPSPVKEIVQGLINDICNSPGLPIFSINADIKINNITSLGANGDRLFAFVLPATDGNSSNSCSDPHAVMTGVTASTDGCLELFSTGALAPNTEYYLVIDGENGQLLTYDITISYTSSYSDLGLPCLTAPRSAKTTQKENTNMVLNYLKPVPSSDYINFSYSSPTDGNSNIVIKDVTGKLIYSENASSVKGNNERSLNIGSFAKGVYFMTIESGNQKLYSKFVKID